ncbi:MAG TPA: TetR family transcriptional regulator C-terminal domain-containing protein [Steroidobacteraceae bacterium]|nr:TetR family transcriptional regulator C-terminal domain-containing protein [Steroidobacteraceae bacterium]
MPLRALARTAGANKPRFVRQLPEQRRRALIAATIECLKRFGHEGLSIRTISAQAGVSVGLINHHFPNKDELIAAAYRHFNGELMAVFRSAVERAPGDDPRARLHAFFQAHFSPPNLDQDVLAVWVVFWGMYRHSRHIQRVHRDNLQEYVQLLRGMLGELMKQERPGARLELRLPAIGLNALLDGLWLEYCLEPGHFRPAEAVALCEAWVDNLLSRTDRSALE